MIGVVLKQLKHDALDDEILYSISARLRHKPVNAQDMLFPSAPEFGCLQNGPA